jgi:nondiscriminating glutamyl-tRNA synthetase
VQKSYGRRENKWENEGTKPSFRFKVNPQVIEFEDK